MIVSEVTTIWRYTNVYIIIIIIILLQYTRVTDERLKTDDII